MIETITISAVSLVAGIAIGNLLYARAHNGLRFGKPFVPGDADSTRTLMVESAYEKNTSGKEKLLRKARRIAKAQIRVIDKCIKERAAQGQCSLQVEERCGKRTMGTEAPDYVDCLFCLGNSSGTRLPMWIPLDDRATVSGMVASMLRSEYKKRGYDVDAWVGTHWDGTVLTNVRIDWSAAGFDKDNLDKIEFDSQVDAYKAGVPLEDILA